MAEWVERSLPLWDSKLGFKPWLSHNQWLLTKVCLSLPGLAICIILISEGEVEWVTQIVCDWKCPCLINELIIQQKEGFNTVTNKKKAETELRRYYIPHSKSSAMPPTSSHVWPAWRKCPSNWQWSQALLKDADRPWLQNSSHCFLLAHLLAHLDIATGSTNIAVPTLYVHYIMPWSPGYIYIYTTQYSLAGCCFRGRT